MGNAPKHQTSHAILVLNGKYLLQLRDNKPTIPAPGQWCLFGGMLENGEDPIDGVKREIFEELSIRPSNYRELWHEDYYVPLLKAMARTWFFAAEVDETWDEHKLNEGRDVKAFAYEDLAGLEMPAVMRKTIQRYHWEMNEQGGENV